HLGRRGRRLGARRSGDRERHGEGARDPAPSTVSFFTRCPGGNQAISAATGRAIVRTTDAFCGAATRLLAWSGGDRQEPAGLCRGPVSAVVRALPGTGTCRKL